MAAEEAPAAAKADEPSEQAKPRERVVQERITGLVVEWRGYMGWIKPFSKINHSQAEKHQGRVYLSVRDIAQYGDLNLRVKEGRLVDFFVYADGDGLGAEECRPRSVLRLTMTHTQAGKALKGMKSQWSDNLPESSYYPAFEKDTGVLLRKYTWQMPFALIELWGHPDDVARAAVKLGTRGDSATCQMRLLLPEADVAKTEGLPGKPKLSPFVVLNDPVLCKTLNWQTTPEECEEAAKMFLRVMGPPPKRTAPAEGAQ